MLSAMTASIIHLGRLEHPSSNPEVATFTHS